jgi:hypothetical protein
MTLSRSAVVEVVSRNRGFGYVRVRDAVRALVPPGPDGRKIDPPPSALRRLIAECADAAVAAASAPIAIPAALVDEYLAPIGRIRDLVEVAPDEFFSLEHDPFVKDLALCLGQLFPAGARLVDLRSGLPRRLLLWQRGGALRALRFFLSAGGFAPWLQTHVDPRDLSQFSEAGLVRTYLRVAAMLEANPNVLGVFGGSWFYDPCLETLSPHLAYLQRLPRGYGAGLFRAPTTPGTIRSALLKSKRRKEAYEQGSYRPQSYFLAWPRRGVLAWARASGGYPHELPQRPI